MMLGLVHVTDQYRRPTCRRCRPPCLHSSHDWLQELANKLKKRNVDASEAKPVELARAAPRDEPADDAAVRTSMHVAR